MVSAARMHDFNKKKVHPSFRLQHREYIFPLLQGCIHQENVFFPLPQRCIHRDNIFFRCRRGAYIKKIYFLALKYLSPRARMVHFHGIIPF